LREELTALKFLEHFVEKGKFGNKFLVEDIHHLKIDNQQIDQEL
jgi:hypothetical protein